MLTKAQGDIFAQTQEAVAHGCNCLGVMGAGFAAHVRDRYSSAMLKEYRRRCMNGLFRPGDIMHWEEPDMPALYNLGTQEYPGSNATYGAVAFSVEKMLMDAERRGIQEIAIPRIGCGIGGLEWEKTLSMLITVGWDSPIKLVVYSL